MPAQSGQRHSVCSSGLDAIFYASVDPQNVTEHVDDSDVHSNDQKGDTTTTARRSVSTMILCKLMCTATQGEPH